jgi:hypothetical protein
MNLLQFEPLVTGCLPPSKFPSFNSLLASHSFRQSSSYNYILLTMPPKAPVTPGEKAAAKRLQKKVEMASAHSAQAATPSEIETSESVGSRFFLTDEGNLYVS